MLMENEQLTKLPLDQSTYLGPARVRQVAGSRVQLEFPDELPWAVMALAYPYQASIDDVVLAVGQGQNYYVIGVIQGKGKTTLMVPGDFELIAPRGSISMVAGKKIRWKSPEINVMADILQLTARRVLERFTDATRWVRATWQIRAGRVRTQVERDWRVVGKRIIHRAKEDVKIDGKKIHLG